MLLHMLLAFAVGIEAGYQIPAVGFRDINAGTGFSIYCLRKVGFVDITAAAQTVFYSGDNSSYHSNAVGFRLGLQKGNWPISPVLEIGADYISRDLHQYGESGFALAYSLGVILNFRINQVSLHPKICYDGLTDMEAHAGFIGVRLGIGHEI